jgi:hypothetical protein
MAPTARGFEQSYPEPAGSGSNTRNARGRPARRAPKQRSRSWFPTVSNDCQQLLWASGRKRAVQVGDPSAAPPFAVGAVAGASLAVAPVGQAQLVRKDDVRNEGAGDAGRRAARSGARFRDALQAAGPGPAAGAESEAAAAAALSGWFRAEPGPRSSAPVPASPAPTPPPAPPARIDRVLIGDAGGDVEARIRIGGGGALDGAEIRLTSSPGSCAVAAQLLTQGDGSRQTLSVALDEIRLRLRGKGIALTAGSARHGGMGAGTGRRSNDTDSSNPGGRSRR